MCNIRYDGYVRRFGLNRRPAIVRYETRHIPGNWYQEERVETTCMLFLDGKRFSLPFNISKPVSGTPASLVTVFPTQPGEDEQADTLEVRRFSVNSPEDWSCLLWDTKEFDRMGDRMAFANLAIALYKFNWDNAVLSSVLQGYPDEVRSKLLDILEYISWSLSESKIVKIKELLLSFGRKSEVVFPNVLIEAARMLSLGSQDTCVHDLADHISESFNQGTNARPEGFLRMLNWLENDNESLSFELIELYHVFLGDALRNDVIKRFFFDVKRGAVQYDSTRMDQLFMSSGYQYYPLLRYVYESYPARRNMEAEFFVDCVNTYRETNQERFQVTDGVLDWVIRKSLERNVPIDLKFYQWLCKCEGGIIINPDFGGFADFKIQYELDEMRFEEEPLNASINSILATCCRQHTHKEEEKMFDPISGDPILDPETGKQMTHSRTVFDPKWSILAGQDEKPIGRYFEQVSLFVNWRSSEDLPTGTFTKEMIDPSVVQERVRQYLLLHYRNECPWISLRKYEPVVSLFGVATKMKAVFNESAIVGKDPGVEEGVVKDRIRNRLLELFGAGFECDYDPAILSKAQTDTLYNPHKSDVACFIERIQYYRRDNERYCAPRLADLPNILTGKRCAICQSDMCFVTSLKKNPAWRDYKLPHVLEILGYSVLAETEAGIIPNEVYNQFVNQVNKAIRFCRLIVCKECGHVLFPAKPNSRSHSLFKCLLPCCEEYNKEVYLNWCHECKTTVIDSRETKKCPNGLYICPNCGSCCSDDFFQMQATKYRLQGIRVPSMISNSIGKGHNNRHIFFCSKCGTKKEFISVKGRYEYLCPDCDRQQKDEPDDYAPPTEESPYA